MDVPILKELSCYGSMNVLTLSIATFNKIKHFVQYTIFIFIKAWIQKDSTYSCY